MIRRRTNKYRYLNWYFLHCITISITINVFVGNNEKLGNSDMCVELEIRSLYWLFVRAINFA